MFTFVHIDSILIKHYLPHVFYCDRFKQQHHNDRANIHGDSVAYCGMSNATNYKGREAHAGSDSTPQQATLLQNGLPRKNGLDLPTATIPLPPTPNSYSLPPPIIPPFPSESVKNPLSISLNNHQTYKNHFDLLSTPHHPQSKYLPSIILRSRTLQKRQSSEALNILLHPVESRDYFHFQLLRFTFVQIAMGYFLCSNRRSLFW